MADAGWRRFKVPGARFGAGASRRVWSRAGVGVVGAALCAGAVVAATQVQGASTSDGAIPTAYRRLTESEYRHSIADIFGPDIRVQGRFEPDVRVGGLLASGTTVLSVTPAGFQAYTQMANRISEQVVAPERRAKLPCAPKTADAPDDACASRILSEVSLAAFRRPVNPEGLKARVALAAQMTKAKKDFYAGLSYSLTSILASPQFLFRTEVAAPDGNGGYTLDAYSRASRLSYLLWNSTPDAELLAAAESGELSTPEGLNKQVDRLMASPRLEVGLRAFFGDLIAPDYFGSVTKDPEVYPAWSVEVYDSAKEETVRTILDVALKQNGDFRDILTTKKTFVNRKLAAAYDVPFSFAGDWAPHEFPKDSDRSGILTQLSVLAMFSHPARSSPTERGKAIADIFLCTATPPPPADVDFSVIDDVSESLKTVRQRLFAHASAPSCNSCHAAMDPLGLSLENFDAAGKFRTLDNGEPIDASAVLAGKSFVGATGLGQVLREDPRFPACMARKVFAYGRGDNVYRTRPTLVRDALDAFKASGYRLPILIRGIATSPQFYAATPPAGAPAADKPQTVATNNRK